MAAHGAPIRREIDLRPILTLIALLVASWTVCAAQVVLVQNLATAEQRRWVYCGLPPSFVPKAQGAAISTDGSSYPFVPANRGARILATVPASSTIKIDLAGQDKVTADGTEVVFAMSADIRDQFSLLPEFECGGERAAPVTYWPPGGARPITGFVRLEEQSPAHQLWHLRTRIVGRDLTIDVWLVVSSWEPTVEWTVQMVWGTTAGGGISATLPAVFMRSAHAMHRDFEARLGLPPNEPQADGTWLLMLTPNALPFGRASRVECRGAFLCAQDNIRLQGLPLCALFAGWEGAWLALGAVPQRYPGAAQEQKALLQSFLEQRPLPFGHYALRTRCQPKESGTTGEQVGFGAAPSLAVMMQDPWEIQDGFWHAQSYALRPTGNKESNGDPVRAADHPRAVCTNLRPDARFSDADPLGWYVPNPAGNEIPYSWPSSGYSTSDGQHRDDGFLDAMIALTDDAALKQTLQDMLEMQKLQLKPVGSSPGVPREIGRVSLALANALWLGFTDAQPILDELVARTYANASMRRLPVDDVHTVRIVGGFEEAKYGWFGPDGRPVIGWQSWQETICAIGMLAAWRAGGWPKARDLALDEATTVVQHCLYQLDGSNAWLHVYAQRTRTGADFGVPFSRSSYFPQDAMHPNYDLFTDGAAFRWSLVSARILTWLLPGTAQAKKAADVIRWYGPSRSRADGQWWAIPR